MEDIQGGYYLDELPSEQQFSILGAVQARAHAEGAQSTWADQGSSSQDRARRREADSQSIDEDHRDDLSDSDLSSWDSEDHERRLQQEWDENVRQLQTIIQIMLLPFFGKWLGRKWSYWAFARWQNHGLTPSFFGFSWMFATDSFLPSSGVAALQP